MSATHQPENGIALVMQSVRHAFSRLLTRLLASKARPDKLDPPKIPLSRRVVLQSLPPEVLDTIGFHLDPPASPLGPLDHFVPDTSAIPRGTLRSPSNSDQLSLYRVCRHTLYCFTPRLRIRLPDALALTMWTEAPQGLIPRSVSALLVVVNAMVLNVAHAD